MNEGVFWSSFDESIRLLKSINFFKEDNRHKLYNYSQDCKDYSRSGSYRDIYDNLVNNRDFDIQLYDDSLFQMSFKNGESRLLFIQCPIAYRSFDDFIKDYNLCSEDVESLKLYLENDYEQYKSESELNIGALYIRYDVDSKGRKEDIHSYTHLHIGLNNKLRIPVGIHLTPLSFVLFIIRQVYYDKWSEIINNHSLDNAYYDFKKYCGALDPNQWTVNEQKTLYIS